MESGKERLCDSTVGLALRMTLPPARANEAIGLITMEAALGWCSVTGLGGKYGQDEAHCLDDLT